MIIRPNQTAKVLSDVVSYNKKHNATAGEIVTIVSISKPVVIVENSNGLRFPTLIENLKIYE